MGGRQGAHGSVGCVSSDVLLRDIQHTRYVHAGGVLARSRTSLSSPTICSRDRPPTTLEPVTEVGISEPSLRRTTILGGRAARRRSSIERSRSTNESISAQGILMRRFQYRLTSTPRSLVATPVRVSRYTAYAKTHKPASPTNVLRMAPFRFTKITKAMMHAIVQKKTARARRYLKVVASQNGR